MTPCEDELNKLLALRTSLLTKIASGVVEIEQPSLGREQYQTTKDLQAALRLLDDQIAALAAVCGVVSPIASARLKRRPVYPVVQEI